MRPTNSRSRPFILTIPVVLLTMAPTAHAYLDPGTGSIILQSLLAGIAVAIGLLRLYWYRFKSFVTTLMGNEQDLAHKDDQQCGKDSDAHNES